MFYYNYAWLNFNVPQKFLWILLKIYSKIRRYSSKFPKISPNCFFKVTLRSIKKLCSFSEISTKHSLNLFENFLCTLDILQNFSEIFSEMFQKLPQNVSRIHCKFSWNLHQISQIFFKILNHFPKISRQTSF